MVYGTTHQFLSSRDSTNDFTDYLSVRNCISDSVVFVCIEIYKIYFGHNCKQLWRGDRSFITDLPKAFFTFQLY